MTHQEILKSYKKGLRFTIISEPTEWSSVLNSNCPISVMARVKYPYHGKIVNIKYENGSCHVAIDDGRYGWSLTTLIEENCIIKNIQDIRKEKLKKLNKLIKQKL